jgi:hypothetical protein
MFKVGCLGSIIVRLRSTESVELGSFFRPLKFHLESPNLLVKLGSSRITLTELAIASLLKTAGPSSSSC